MTFKETIRDLASHAKDFKVLYVEDEPSIRENTHSFLSMIFTKVDVAANGKEGLELYKKEHHDLIVSDVLMPEMNGIEMIRQIKKIDPSQSVIITSATEESSHLLELINIGVAHFILKPMKIEYVGEVLHTVVMNLYNARKAEVSSHPPEKEVMEETNLLEQYKDIVDISMIVSKTNVKGKITYVNDEFCEISGYSREELIGKSHNIIRHPDVPPEVYANMWKVLFEKKTWHGTIKNLKKNGDYYITDATIKPILDENGNVIEFISIRYDITTLFDLRDEIWNAQHELLYILGEVGETRSREIGNHAQRVARYSKLLGQLCHLDDEKVELLSMASPMHDIGKIGIPDEVLLKPGRLNSEEMEIVRRHTSMGYDILKNSKRPILETASIIAYEHHERWDGSGYPRGLAGDAIHLFGRITALADVFDALSCANIYKDSWPIEEILTYFQHERGKQFDPNLVDILIANIDQFIEIFEELRN